MIIAIDFDGTIVEHKFPEIGALLCNAKETINKLYKQGHDIVIWTCRGGSELVDARRFLDLNDIKYTKINENIDYNRIGFQPFPKIYADIYIDDRNLGGFPGWTEVAELFETVGVLK